MPARTDAGLKTPIDDINVAIRKFAPKVKHWWLTTYGVMATFLPIERRDFLPPKMVDTRLVRCSAMQEPGSSSAATGCPNDAKYVSAGLFVSHKAPIVVMEGRVRNFCPSCLYVAMTKALSKVMHPEFFRKSEVNADEADADSIWVVSERAQYLQFCIQEVVAYMEKNDPVGLEALNEKIVADAMKDDK